MPFECWSHVPVLEADRQLLRTLLFLGYAHLPWLTDEERAAIDRLASSGLVTIEFAKARLTERGYRLAFAEPWYVGGGVAFYWYQRATSGLRPV